MGINIKEEIQAYYEYNFPKDINLVEKFAKYNFKRP